MSRRTACTAPRSPLAASDFRLTSDFRLAPACWCQPAARSGPNNTAGGEWAHVHDVLRRTTAVAFPNLLYRMRAGYALNVTNHRRLMRSLNPEVFHWYVAPEGEASATFFGRRRCAAPCPIALP